jgi:hypothetical protein
VAEAAAIIKKQAKKSENKTFNGTPIPLDAMIDLRSNQTSKVFNFSGRIPDLKVGIFVTSIALEAITNPEGKSRRL